jgi:hypothetical protein
MTIEENDVVVWTCSHFPPVDMFEHVFGHESRSIRKVILLSFYPYKERPKRSPYVISVMILVRIVPEIRINLSKSY